MANSLVDWLNEEIQDPQTHQWGWDRLAFFGPQKRSNEVHPRWQQRLDAANPGLKDLIASSARKDYDFAGSNLPDEYEHGAKRKIEEVEEEEEDDDEVEEEEEKFSRFDIWKEQVVMTRRYLKENHQQMRAQGNDPPYFKSYRTFSGYWD